MLRGYLMLAAGLYFGRSVRPQHPNLVTQDKAATPGSLIIVMHDREAAFSATDLHRRTVPETMVGKATLYRITQRK